MQGLVKCFRDPSWDVLAPLLEKGAVALGKDHELMIRGRRVAKALEKEWIHFHSGSEKYRIMNRARTREFESVERDLDAAFVAGELHITQPPADDIPLGEEAGRRSPDEASDVESKLQSPVRIGKASLTRRSARRPRSRSQGKRSTRRDRRGMSRGLRRTRGK